MYSGRFRITVSKICAVLCLVLGMSITLYPWLSSSWNAHTQTKAISGYSETLEKMDEQRYEQMWKEAEQFNDTVIASHFSDVLNEEEKAQYESLLNVESTGMMGYLSIPVIDVNLPVYHGTSDAVLRTGAGHGEWSSLPAGTKGSHCVITGHSGLPSSTLFTNLHKLKAGDRFTLHILNRTMTYEVYEIQTCLPEETDSLRLEENEDLCTLVTCTPYSVNSHRLLVTGRRVYDDCEKTSEEIPESGSDTGIVTAVVLLWSIAWIGFLNQKKGL